MTCAEKTAGTVPDEPVRFSPDFDRKLREYARLQLEAKQLRHALIIQRETVGLRRHEDVDRQYPLPGPLTLPEAARTENEG